MLTLYLLNRKTYMQCPKIIKLLKACERQPQANYYIIFLDILGQEFPMILMTEPAHSFLVLYSVVWSKECPLSKVQIGQLSRFCCDSCILYLFSTSWWDSQSHSFWVKILKWIYHVVSVEFPFLWISIFPFNHGLAGLKVPSGSFPLLTVQICYLIIMIFVLGNWWWL